MRPWQNRFDGLILADLCLFRLSDVFQKMGTSYCEFISDGLMHGTLYEVRGYPGAIKSSDANDKIFGELYKMLDRKRVLVLLDDYEECSERFPKPHEYSRKQVSIELSDGGSVIAWVYLYNHDVSKLQQIISGDYLDG
jgi:gamma-glutamylcyclotransferase (GGCT)/AIG2-like uncharacterized protein YtfP